MNEVIRIFTEIQNTTGLNDKKNIVKQHSDNELFKKCLIFLLDTNIVTGIAEKKLTKPATKNVVPTKQLTTFTDVMDYLKTHNTGSDVDVANVKQFLNQYKGDTKTYNFYVEMITKKFRLGCNKKLVNSVIPNLIQTFDVMLGTPIEKCNLKGNEWISISKKLNGCRCAFIGNKCMTRQGKEYTGVDHIIKDLQRLGYGNMFVDGELLYKNKEGLSDSDAFQKGTGIAMSNDKEKPQLKLVVFDAFPLDEFWTGKSKLSYLDRNNLYLMNLKIVCKDTENIEVVPMVYEGFDHGNIAKFLEYAEQHDWEGIMINLDTPYECKRTKNLIKVKQFKEVDLRCINYEEGTGKNKDTLGAIICDYKGTKLNVGSGFTDSERNHFWDHPEDIVGKIVTVKYKEETKNKNGTLSLQFPIYQCMRFDKNEPSYN